MTERAQVSVGGLGGVLVALAVAAAAHVAHLPPWITLLGVAAGAWRWTAEQRRWSLPPVWLRTSVAVLATLAVLATYRTLNGIEAGTAFLVLMAGVKLLETRGQRDLTVIVFIAYFLLYATLLRDQQLQFLPYLLAGAVVATAALTRVHAGTAGESWRAAARRTGLLMLQATPLALALFLLFPRLPGPFWGIATTQSGRTGLTDEMTPGDVSDLSVSGEAAFRVRFFGATPARAQLYWRGPVLDEFDGRTWRRSRSQAFPEQEATVSGDAVDYQVTLEPHDRRWILALDLPAEWPRGEASRAFDFQLLANRPITEVESFRLRSYPQYSAGATLPVSLRRKTTQLPENGNRRALALGRVLVQRLDDPRAIARAVLDMFRDQPYVYTLQPPQLAGDPVDEFLFETRRGFCEHYASAFTVIMRAAGIPARVVTGYQGGEFNPVGGYLLVRQSDAHAWSEIWLEDRGWVRVDPTAAVAPERIEGGLLSAVADDEPVPGRLRGESELWMQFTLAWDAANDLWNERVLRFDGARQFELLERIGIDDPDWRTLGLGLAASLAAFFVGLSALLAWRYRPPRLDRAARLHAQAATRLGRRGLVPGYAEGPVAYLERAALASPDLAHDIAAIRHAYVALRYGPAPSDGDLRQLKLLVNRLRP